MSSNHDLSDRIDKFTSEGLRIITDLEKFIEAGHEMREAQVTIMESSLLELEALSEEIIDLLLYMNIESLEM